MSDVQRIKYAGTAEGSLPVRPRWMSDSMWRQVQMLQATFGQAYENLTQSVVNFSEQWQAFFKHADPYTFTKSSFDLDEVYGDDEEPPEHVVSFRWEHLSNFQRLTLVRILKPQCLTSSVRQFVEEQMGPSFISFGATDLMELYEKSDAKTPFIFLLSPGN